MHGSDSKNVIKGSRDLVDLLVIGKSDTVKSIYGHPRTNPRSPQHMKKDLTYIYKNMRETFIHIHCICRPKHLDACNLSAICLHSSALIWTNVQACAAIQDIISFLTRQTIQSSPTNCPEFLLSRVC